MAWIKLDDQIAHHPKFLKAGPTASWLWVCCIGYSQKFLTDGFIPQEAFSTLGTVQNADEIAEILVAVRLLDRVDGGYSIHDYLDHNDTREEALARQEELARKRAAAGRLGGIQSGRIRARQIEAKLKQVASILPEAKESKTKPHPIPSVPNKISDTDNKLAIGAGVLTTSEKHSNGNGGGANGRSKHPVYKGQSLVVFDWMLEDLTMMLGPHTEGFHLDEWFQQLDAEAVRSNFIVPKRDKGQWLCEQTLAEARRRGLPMWDPKNTSGAERLTYRPFECPHTPQCTGRSACDVLQRLGR